MNKTLRALFFLAAAVLLASAVSAAELHVGEGQEFSTPRAAARAVKDGDTVVIHAGTYHGDVCAWSADRLTIRGEGSDKVFLEADGQLCMGKGIWVVSGSGVTISGVTFRGAACPDKNGAGIRVEPSATGLTVRGCVFRDNQNGILSGTGDGSMTVEFCEFVHNGAGDGYSHNIYIGKIRKLIFRHNLSHHAPVGHGLKSRALETVVEGCRFDDGMDGRSSYLADFPNGGKVVVRDCCFRQSPAAENGRMVCFGLEGSLHPDGGFLLENNTFVNLRESPGSFVVAEGMTPVARGNTFEGPGDGRLE